LHQLSRYQVLENSITSIFKFPKICTVSTSLTRYPELSLRNAADEQKKAMCNQVVRSVEEGGEGKAIPYFWSRIKGLADEAKHCV
jgi:hypothetical protein